MDILYIVGKGSKCNNFELRASLRSIEKYGKNIGNVYVVGYCPEWLSDNVVKISCEDLYQGDITNIQKAHNICYKILYAIDNSDIGDEFIVSTDDHFYTRNTDFDNYPYFANVSVNNGMMPDKPKNHEYLHFLYECGLYMKKIGFPTFYMTLHRNMHLNRKSLNDCRPMIEKCIKDGIPCEIFTFVNNYDIAYNGVSPVFVKDVKIKGGSEWWKTSDEYTEVFSTHDFSYTSGLFALLKGRYNKISKFEKYE